MIYTEVDYLAALREVSALIDLDPSADSPEGKRLDVLGGLVQAYEAKHYPIEAVSKPIQFIAMAKLLGIAKAIVESSTAVEAAGFDPAAWLEKWLQLPQPSLGGRKPADLLDTPTGVEMVTRLLGAIESGAYQ